MTAISDVLLLLLLLLPSTLYGTMAYKIENAAHEAQLYPLSRQIEEFLSTTKKAIGVFCVNV